jgi:hypothetical protein
MTTIVERDSSNSVVVALLILLLAVGLGIAYFSGAFTGGTTTRIIENNRTIEKETVLPVPMPEEKSASQPEKPAQEQPAQ